jgi:serine O-acetyltransferase
MIETVRRDIERYLRGSTGDRRARILAIVTNCGLQAVLTYRLGRWLLETQRRYWFLFPLLLPGWIAYALGVLVTRAGYGIHLALSADIGPGLCIWHFGGIDVRDCTIGTNCALAQHTRIGREPGAGGPVIGDRVWLSPHVRIVGPFSIGAGATIGAGVTISEDVPAAVLIVGSPARVTMQAYDNSLFNF